MATRRVIKGVLGNFLGTYVSRYSDYDGYLLFGFLVGQLDELRVNLLGQSVSEPLSPLGVAVLTAVTKFEEQRRKAGLAASRIREASLTVRRLPGLVSGSINRQPCSGFNISFRAAAVMDDGKNYERERVVFVAPHQAAVELSSGRAAKPPAAADHSGPS
jgi:hypothetical protein